MTRKGILVVVSGPSGVGKSTLCQTMTSMVAETTLSLSYTTRRPRPGERDGIDYCFVQEDRFREMIQNREFAEWAEIYGQLYGTPHSSLRQSMDSGVDVLLDIDAQGAREIMKRFSEAVYVFVVPPSLEALRARLVHRAGDSPDEIQRRLQKASEEIRNYKSYHYLIRNDDLARATKELESIIIAERVKTNRIGVGWLVEKKLLGEGERNTDSHEMLVTKQGGQEHD